MFLYGNYITINLWGKKKERNYRNPKLLKRIVTKWVQDIFFFFSDKSDLLEQLEWWGGGRGVHKGKNGTHVISNHLEFWHRDCFFFRPSFCWYIFIFHLIILKIFQIKMWLNYKYNWPIGSLYWDIK